MQGWRVASASAKSFAANRAAICAGRTGAFAFAQPHDPPGDETGPRSHDPEAFSFIGAYGIATLQRAILIPQGSFAVSVLGLALLIKQYGELQSRDLLVGELRALILRQYR